MTELVGENLSVTRLDNGKRSLNRALTVRLKGGKSITVPKGFATDYSSIPYVCLILAVCLVSFLFSFGPLMILVLLIPPVWSKVDIAGVVHDFLYVSGAVPKWEADKVWLELAMAGESHARWWQAYPCWFFGLVIGGIPTWLKYRKKYMFVHYK